MATSSLFFAALILPMALVACKPQQAEPSPNASPVTEASARPVSLDKPTSVGTQADSKPAPQDNGFADLAESLHLNCENAANGTGCVSGNMEAGDFYDIDLSPSCDADGNFAGLAEPNAALLDSLPVTGSKAQTTARLSNKQFVCILATAHTGQQSDYYYVAAIPPTSVSACRGKPICNLYGERPIEFITQHKQGKICTLTSDARPEGDCAHGWIEAQKLDVFSDGI